MHAPVLIVNLHNINMISFKICSCVYDTSSYRSHYL